MRVVLLTVRLLWLCLLSPLAAEDSAPPQSKGEGGKGDRRTEAEASRSLYHKENYLEHKARKIMEGVGPLYRIRTRVRKGCGKTASRTPVLNNHHNQRL